MEALACKARPYSLTVVSDFLGPEELWLFLATSSIYDRAHGQGIPLSSGYYDWTVSTLPAHTTAGRDENSGVLRPQAQVNAEHDTATAETSVMDKYIMCLAHPSEAVDLEI